MAEARSDLTSRVLPATTLCFASSLAPRPLELHNHHANSNPPIECFRVSGVGIIAGGAGDLGAAFSRALFEHGLQNLTILDAPSEETAEPIISRLSSDFPLAKITFTRVDVADSGAVEKAVDAVVQTLGPITILANFVGVVCCEHAVQHSLHSWRRAFETNNTGSFAVAQAVARTVVTTKKGGSIILVASISGTRVNFPNHQVEYNASKAAVIMMKSYLAVGWGA
ncbi:gluconate 5-dehydrogenase [Triangularia setosa]|uniref:Gluconate 5-dehydrogenase n=1 Tax=Triangularia setosa TaxID=2587417 RepID=A0AAN6W401_9PEZI|nr:gluconate 5-dehydrogenase [Podospora setosa]